MQIERVRSSEITSDLWQQWHLLQQSNPLLASPYFRPEFFQAMVAIGRPFEVAVVQQQGQVVGLFPFERRRFDAGRPVAWPMSDYQGIIAAPETELDLTRIVRGTGLRSYDFDHFVAGQLDTRQVPAQIQDSIQISLEKGFAAVREACEADGSNLFKDLAKKQRKVERDLGPVRLVWDEYTPAVLQQLMVWKTQQYHATGLVDLFASPWPGELLKTLREQRNEHFDLMITTLYFGDRLAAAELFLRSGSLLHSWFPGYNVEFGRYSPGSMLFRHFLEAAPAQGVLRIDLGKGTEAYKLRFRSAGVPVAEGAVVVSPMTKVWRSCWSGTRHLLKTTGARRWLEQPISWIRKARKSLALQ